MLRWRVAGARVITGQSAGCNLLRVRVEISVGRQATGTRQGRCWGGLYCDPPRNRFSRLVSFWSVLDKGPDFALLITIHYGRFGRNRNGKLLNGLRLVARMALQIQLALVRRSTEAEGAGYRKVVAPIARPFSVHLEEPFLNACCDLWHQLLVKGCDDWVNDFGVIERRPIYTRRDGSSRRF